MERRYFECHITMEAPSRYAATLREQQRASVEALHWIYSCIDGDPVFGAGVKSYATRQFLFKGECVVEETKEIEKILDETAAKLRAKGWRVLRQKIELVLVDKRIMA